MVTANEIKRVIQKEGGLGLRESWKQGERNESMYLEVVDSSGEKSSWIVNFKLFFPPVLQENSLLNQFAVLLVQDILLLNSN
jgi:hypothetical protein